MKMKEQCLRGEGEVMYREKEIKLVIAGHLFQTPFLWLRLDNHIKNQLDLRCLLDRADQPIAISFGFCFSPN